MDSTIVNTLNIIKGPYLWLIMLIFSVFIYLLLSLVNKNFKKPLRYLGITIIISGVLFIILRFLSPTLIKYIFEENVNIVKIFMPRILKTITNIGIIYIIIGVILIIIHKKNLD